MPRRGPEPRPWPGFPRRRLPLWRLPGTAQRPGMPRGTSPPRSPGRPDGPLTRGSAVPSTPGRVIDLPGHLLGAGLGRPVRLRSPHRTPGRNRPDRGARRPNQILLAPQRRSGRQPVAPLPPRRALAQSYRCREKPRESADPADPHQPFIVPVSSAAVTACSVSIWLVQHPGAHRDRTVTWASSC
jgi:hypothetical protein